MADDSFVVRLVAEGSEIAKREGYRGTVLQRITDGHIVFGNGEASFWIALSSPARVYNEQAMNTLLASYVRELGVRMVIGQTMLYINVDGTSYLCGMFRHIGAGRWMNSIVPDAHAEPVPQSVYDRMARLVFFLDGLPLEIVLTSGDQMFHRIWGDDELRRRFVRNVVMARTKGLISWTEAKLLVKQYAEVGERRWQHHDMGPWNWTRPSRWHDPNADWTGLVDLEFGGWRHRWYDAVYLLLQWTVNKPYPHGVEQWMVALERALADSRPLDSFDDLFYEGRRAIAYRLMATAGELDASNSARERFRGVVRLLLDGDFKGFERFFREDVFTL